MRCLAEVAEIVEEGLKQGALILYHQLEEGGEALTTIFLVHLVGVNIEIEHLPYVKPLDMLDYGSVQFVFAKYQSEDQRVPLCGRLHLLAGRAQYYAGLVLIPGEHREIPHLVILQELKELGFLFKGHLNDLRTLQVELLRYLLSCGFFAFVLCFNKLGWLLFLSIRLLGCPSII